MRKFNVPLSGVIILCGVSWSHAEGSLAIQWLSYCSQNTRREQATILSPADESLKRQGNFCIAFENQEFEPIMGDYSDAGEKSATPGTPATMLLVSVDPKKLNVKNATLVVSVEQKMPVCQECDGGCWKLLKWTTVSKSYPLTDKRIVVNVRDIIASWNLMGIRVKARILDGTKVIDESHFEKEGWAWCA